MKEYLRRLWNVLVFFGIWWGIPFYLVYTYDDGAFFVFILFTWIPAGFITLYLTE